MSLTIWPPNLNIIFCVIPIGNENVSHTDPCTEPLSNYIIILERSKPGLRESSHLQLRSVLAEGCIPLCAWHSTVPVVIRNQRLDIAPMRLPCRAFLVQERSACPHIRDLDFERQPQPNTETDSSLPKKMFWYILSYTASYPLNISHSPTLRSILFYI